MDAVTKEIRQILIGNIVPKGKYFEVPEYGMAGLRSGLTDSADMIIIFGVARHTRYYKIDGNPNKIKAAGHKALMNIGRKVIIRSNPEAEVSYCKYMVTRPIVILFEVDDIGAKVETYTSRGIFGLISEIWIRWKFMKYMPELVQIDRKTLSGIFKSKEEARRKIEEERLKAEEEEKKKLKEEQKKNKEDRKKTGDRKKKKAIEALEKADLTDEDIEAIIAARNKEKEKKLMESENSDSNMNEKTTETETAKRYSGLKGAKKRFQRPPRLSEEIENKKEETDS